MREPIRWVQTNLRETDAALNPHRFVGQIADFGGNVLLMTVGGISACYPIFPQPYEMATDMV